MTQDFASDEEWVDDTVIHDRRGHEIGCLQLLQRLAAFDGRLRGAGLQLRDSELLGDHPETELRAVVADPDGREREVTHRIWQGREADGVVWQRAPVRVVRDVVDELVAPPA